MPKAQTALASEQDNQIPLSQGTPQVALRASEEFARNVVESSPDCIKTLDLDGRLLSMNEGGCRLMEIDDMADYTLKAWSSLWPEPGRSEAERAILAARRGEKSQFEGYCPSAKGEPRWWEVRVTPIADSEGKTLRILSVSRDVTERKTAETALAAKARLAELGAEVGVALAQSASLSEALRVCAESVVRYSEAAFARVWTLSPGADFLQLRASAGSYTHLDGPHARIPVGAFKIGYVAQRRQPWFSSDVPHDKMTTDPEWAQREGMVAFAGYPLLLEDKVVGVLGVFARHLFSDDTLSALAALATTLAIGINRYWAEDVLLAQRRELERSNADLEHFAFAAAHDLQEPLRMVNIYAELLAEKLKGTMDPEGRDFLERITGGATRMSILLQDLLTFAETSRHPGTELVAVDLNPVVAGVLENLRPGMEQGGARVTVGLLPTVCGREEQFLQLFQNLIGNALKYRSQRTPEIRVSANLAAAEWIFRVEDNGLGISPEHHQHVFGVFKRLHGRDIPGTGIGLAICQRIVDRNRGRIWVESAGEGHGSTFCFTWPQTIAAPSAV